MPNFRLIVFALVGLLLSRASGGDPPSNVDPVPLSLHLTLSAPFSAKKGWELTVNADKTTHLTVETFSTFSKPPQTFQVSAAQWAQFRKAVVKEQFFTLGTQYGGQMPDGDKRILSIQQGQKTKSVTLFTLSSADPKLPEIKRALRLWKIAESWVNGPDIKKMQPYDQRILDAPVKK
jgi:hypothetical protein